MSGVEGIVEWSGGETIERVRREEIGWAGGVEWGAWWVMGGGDHGEAGEEPGEGEENKRQENFFTFNSKRRSLVLDKTNLFTKDISDEPLGEDDSS